MQSGLAELRARDSGGRYKCVLRDRTGQTCSVQGGQALRPLLQRLSRAAGVGAERASTACAGECAAVQSGWCTEAGGGPGRARGL